MFTVPTETLELIRYSTHRNYGVALGLVRIHHIRALTEEHPDHICLPWQLHEGGWSHPEPFRYAWVVTVRYQRYERRSDRSLGIHPGWHEWEAVYGVREDGRRFDLWMD
jgi:hypothetical protein